MRPGRRAAPPERSSLRPAPRRVLDERIDGERHQQDAVREQQAGCQAPRRKAQDAGGGGREHVRGIVIEHERLSGEQERRQALHVRISELRDLGGVNRVVRPDRNDAGRLDGRQRTRRHGDTGRQREWQSPRSPERRDHRDARLLEPSEASRLRPRARQPLHARNTFAASVPVVMQPTKRTRLVARLPSRIAITWCDGYASPIVQTTITDPAIATMVPPKNSEAIAAASSVAPPVVEHGAGECRQHEPVQQGRHGQLPGVRAQSSVSPERLLDESGRCRRHGTAPSRSTGEIGSADR